MSDYKTELQKILLLKTFENLDTQLKLISKHLTEKEFAHFFIDHIYIRDVIHFVLQDYWVQNKNSAREINFEKFIKTYFPKELKPLLFLHSFFLSSTIEILHTAGLAMNATNSILLNIIKTKDSGYQKVFLQFALKRMAEFFEHIYQVNSSTNEGVEKSKLSLYRSFDILDEIFELDYLKNEVASINQKERLYEGAGVGVQSSYSTTISAFQYLNLAKGSSFIDLGSGYGRIGLILGLMRPDIQFAGYEFVKERVDIANKASIRLAINDHVQFIAQDLSDPIFKIPMANTYYIYDSFTDETYVTIMDQLQRISQSKRITIVTKGNAKLWINNTFWSKIQELNDGNICFFRSNTRLLSF